MTRTLLSITALSLSVCGSASANDIVDFFRAVSRPSPQVHNFRDDHRAIGHDHGRVALQPVGRGRSLPTSYRDVHDVSLRNVGNSRLGRPVGISRSGFSVSLNYVNPGPTRVAAVPRVPVYPIAPLPIHRIGEIVTCPVPLEPHVTIQNACRVAPNAVPQVVAVRNPHLGPIGSRGCVESLVYVEILAPPCAPRRVRVSPCGTKVSLDYGRYDVHIVSCDDVIHITYR